MEDELVKIWQSSPNQERIKFEKSRLMIDVQSSVDNFHKKIKYRDMMEQIAIVLGIPVFAYYAYSIPFTATKIASVLIIFWGIYVATRLQQAKKHKPGAFSETYLAYLYKTREYINIQKQLIENILYWYILPAVMLMSLFVLGPGITGRLTKIVKVEAGIVAVGIATYVLNKRAVKKQFNPRIEKIEALIQALETQ